MRNKMIISLLLVILTPMLAFALPSDKNQPAKISSNSADYNQKTGISVFIGNVIVTQGTTKITAQKLIVYTDKKQHLSKAIAYGETNTPAVYETTPKKGDKPFIASAKTIEYLPKVNKILLIGNGKLEQNHNTLKSNYIIYDQKTGQLQTKHTGKSRTVIILQPSTTLKKHQAKKS